MKTFIDFKRYIKAVDEISEMGLTPLGDEDNGNIIIDANLVVIAVEDLKEDIDANSTTNK